MIVRWAIDVGGALKGSARNAVHASFLDVARTRAEPLENKPPRPQPHRPPTVTEIFLLGSQDAVIGRDESAAPQSPLTDRVRTVAQVASEGGDRRG